MHVKQCLECLTGLLNNDEDMLALLITEKDEAEQQGLQLDPSRHIDVELLLEEYGRQLSNILFEINYMLQRLQSKQDFVTLALSSYRNRMIRMNLYMSISGLSLGIGTASAGFFGMNLVNGLESHPTAFYMVIGGTCFMGATVAASCFSFISGKTMQNRAEQRLSEIQTLTSALSDMNALDVTIKKFLRTKHMSMSQEEFRKELLTSRTSRHVTDEEVELLFSALDIHKDGMLLQNDFESLQQMEKEHQAKKQKLKIQNKGIFKC
jgi:magnesium transporter